jgi:hypothetical protein
MIHLVESDVLFAMGVETFAAMYTGKLASHLIESQCVTGLTLEAITILYRGADKSLARPGRKQATAIEDFEFHISYL